MPIEKAFAFLLHQSPACNRSVSQEVGRAESQIVCMDRQAGLYLVLAALKLEDIPPYHSDG